MDSDSVCSHTSDLQNRTLAKLDSDLLITCMITDRIALHSVLLPINNKDYNFREAQEIAILLMK